MAHALYSLLWFPTTCAFEATRFAERPLPARDAVVLHRRQTPNLAMGAAYAEVGAELLPAHARPKTGAGVRLLWLPILPSRCLLVARDAVDGMLRVTEPPRGAGDLSTALVDLEVACAVVFDETFHAREPDQARIRSGLAAAYELAVGVIARLAEHGSPPRLWSPREALS